MGLYNYGIMNLMDIPHFGCGKKVGLCIKQLVTHVHGGILWMDRPVQIDVAMISKSQDYLHSVYIQRNTWITRRMKNKS
jgi:hypothetical protein